LVADSYCMNPDCTCQDAVLNLVQVYPRENRKTDSFMIGFKLNGREYKIRDHGKFKRREIQAIVIHFIADDTFQKFLNERFQGNEGKSKRILS
jgi:hypothetical protein